MWDVTKNKQGDYKKMFLIQTSRVSWQTLFMSIGTLCALCTILITQMNQWLIKIVLVTFIGLHPWINTQNNKLNQSYVNNTRHYVMNTIMPHHWKRLMFSMWPFIVGGVP
jgi:putative Mn2+ efflux pump MntP